MSVRGTVSECDRLNLESGGALSVVDRDQRVSIVDRECRRSRSHDIGELSRKMESAADDRQSRRCEYWKGESPRNAHVGAARYMKSLNLLL